MYRVVAGTQSLGLGLSASRDVGPAPPAAPAPSGPAAAAAPGAPAAAPAPAGAPAPGAGPQPPVRLRHSFRQPPNNNKKKPQSPYHYHLILFFFSSIIYYARAALDTSDYPNFINHQENSKKMYAISGKKLYFLINFLTHYYYSLFAFE